MQILARLLKSSHPEDLRAANKLIKEMVQEVRLGRRGAGGRGLGGSGWHQGSSGSLSSCRQKELLPKILQQQLLKSPCVISVILWLLEGMALGAFCGPSPAAALDLWQFHHCLGSAGPEMTWSFILEWELFGGQHCCAVVQGGGVLAGPAFLLSKLQTGARTSFPVCFPSRTRSAWRRSPRG